MPGLSCHLAIFAPGLIVVRAEIDFLWWLASFRMQQSCTHSIGVSIRKNIRN